MWEWEREKRKYWFTIFSHSSSVKSVRAFCTILTDASKEIVLLVHDDERVRSACCYLPFKKMFFATMTSRYCPPHLFKNALHPKHLYNYLVSRSSKCFPPSCEFLSPVVGLLFSLGMCRYEKHSHFIQYFNLFFFF